MYIKGNEAVWGLDSDFTSKQNGISSYNCGPSSNNGLQDIVEDNIININNTHVGKAKYTKIKKDSSRSDPTNV